MLFQYIIIDIMNILHFIIVFLQVTGSISLVIVGTSQTRSNGKINKAILFTIAGFIVAIYLAINERIFYLLWGLSGEMTILIFMVRHVLIYIIPNVIFLITFGALFLFLGIKNKQNFGKYLRYSGIFWIVFGVIAIAATSILLFTPYFGGFSIQLYLTGLYMIPIASIFMVTASVFFMIYAGKLDIKILLYSSIFLLVASSIFAVNSLLQLIMFYL